MNSTTYLTPFWIKDESGTSAIFTVKILNDGQSNTPQLTIYYSTDATNWSLLGNTVSGGTLSKDFSAGSKIYLSCTTNSWAKTTSTSATASSNNNRIGASKNFSVGGNIMSLIYGTTFADNRKYTTFPDDSIAGIFGGLFYNQSLVDAGELVLPVTHSTSSLPASGTPITGPLYGCYRRMFENCSSLVNGPHIDLRDRGSLDLPYCFQRMFTGCTSLLSLHINTVGANYRYNAMFNNNGGAQGGICYDYSGGLLSSAFPTNRWTRQNVISMYDGYDRVVDWHSNRSGYVEQVDDNNSVTIYKKINEKNIPFNVTNITSSPITMSVRKISTNYSSGSYNGASDAPTITIEYSDDNLLSWKTWCTTSTTLQSLTIPAYTTYYFRASASRWAYHFYWGTSHIELTAFNNITFSGSSTVELAGNIVSLLYGSSFTGNETSFPNISNTYVFSHLFGRESYSGETYTAIKHVKNLIMPVTTLNRECYSMMFYYNTNLIDSPNLPATTLAVACYSMMFRYCTSLMYASSLPATTLANECYYSMFSGCTSLTTAPELRATTIPYYTGELGNYIGAYDGMFTNCTSLNYVKCLATTNTDGVATHSWLDNVSSAGTFIKAANTNWTSGTSGIPSGWTVVEQ